MLRLFYDQDLELMTMPGFAELVVSAVVFAIVFGVNKIKRINVDFAEKGKKSVK